MARPRLPDEVKRQRGTWRPGREASRQPQPVRDDPDGVYAEFDELVAQAAAEGALDGFRQVHKAAFACLRNGYDVSLHALPYLIALSAAELNATTDKERQSFRNETNSVYADLRAYHEGVVFVEFH